MRKKPGLLFFSVMGALPPSVFLSLDKTERRSPRALRSSLPGHSLRSPLGASHPRRPGSTKAQAASLSRSAGGIPEGLVRRPKQTDAQPLIFFRAPSRISRATLPQRPAAMVVRGSGRCLTPFPLENLQAGQGARNGTYRRDDRAGHASEGRNPQKMAGSGGGAMAGRRMSLLACDLSAGQEEPWRRLLQELSEAGRKEKEEFAKSRRRLGISVESVWLVPTKPSGGGLTVVYLEAEDPEWVLRELAASDAPFDSGYGTQMRKLFGFDPARLRAAASGELLAWHDDARGEPEASKRA